MSVANSTESKTIPAEDSYRDEEPFDMISKNSQLILKLHIIFCTYFHIAGLYGLYQCFISVKWATIGLGLLMYVVSGIGITAGAHRLWSHKSYKAKLPLQILLMVCSNVAFQKTWMIKWISDHRLHHKFCDTDADPHNARRGFFFSHIGWMLSKKSDEVVKAEKRINISDIYNNPVLQFQKKYAIPLIGTFCFALPTVIPMYFWGETLNNAWHTNMLRYIVTLNVTFCVNSVAHKWGYKPYDKNILPSHNTFVILTTLGEGFHNYHHVYPWDYRTAELGNNMLNPTTYFIDFFAWVGWAYDLKTAYEEGISKRAEKTGDGTDLWGAMKTIKGQ